MKIVRIFGEKLFAFQYKSEKQNEYDRLMALWTDPLYLREYLKENLPSGSSINEMVMRIRDDSEALDDALAALASKSNLPIETRFKPLYNLEYHLRPLSKQKTRENYLRLYAIRIDKDCFVITGGAIKLTHLMEDDLHTQKELDKLNTARAYLQENGINDADSFYEFIIELENEQ
jgi:hypothetical protein